MSPAPQRPATFDNVAEIVRLLEQRAEPPTVGELLDELKAHVGVDTLTGRWLERVIATSDGRINVGNDGLVRARQATRTPRPAPVDPADPGRPLRLVAIDFEALPRHRPDGTIERIPLQVGAHRFGRDTAWTSAKADIREAIAADAALLPLHPGSAKLADAIDHGSPTSVVADLLAGIVDGADIVVAYNGTDVDFPILTRMLAGAHPHALDTVVDVDAKYLAHAIWPRRANRTLPDGRTVTAHTLEGAADAAGVWRPQTHDGLDDCHLLVDVLAAAAARTTTWPQDLRDVIFAATRNSHAWALLADLSDPRPTRERVTAVHVRDALTDVFADLPPERQADHHHDDDDAPVPPAFDVPDTLRHDGRVDAYLLVAETRTGAARRPAQQRTAEKVRDIVGGGSDGLVEAPTGSGKSMVLLAEAFEWVAGAPDRRAVISTFTKQLQTQLAGDLDALANVVTGLRDHVDLVKGAGNRLSLRSLVAATTALATGAAHRTGISPRLAADPAFAELVAYLLLRLLAMGPAHPDGPARIADVWASRSVDRVDLPGSFDQWTGGTLPRLLAELSQGRAGDWKADDTQALAAHTIRVGEALRRRRIIVANHALLTSTASTLADLSEDNDLLLLVDEAHELESAATSTMSATLDYAGVEAVVADLETIAGRESAKVTTDTDDPAPDDGSDDGGHVPPDVRRQRFVAGVRDVVALLRSEQLPAAVASSFGMRSGADLLFGHGARSVSVADEDADGGQLERAANLERLLRVFVGRLATTAEALDSLPAATSAEEADERDSARSRLVDTLVAAAAIRSDLADLVGVTPDDDNDADAPTSDDVLAIVAADSDVDHAPAGQASNRIVWATEAHLKDDRLDRFIEGGMSLRHWPFTLTTTPIAVCDDPRWQQLRGAFTATVFTSGTLRVPGAEDPWAFIRGRLGLDAHTVVAHHVTSDFEPADQGLLVAFSDFPSWAEQARAAGASVAWQVDRFAREAVTPDGDHGALVLTTSRAASNDIADRLVVLRDADDHHWIHSAALEGNAGATASFRQRGGILVGTRGLWQGVDLPAERLRLVWINKLPFPPIGDPVLEARRRRIEVAAAEAGDDDPELAAMVGYYLPHAAMAFRQAVGRLLRSHEHRGVVVVSDPKLSGEVKLRRTYRRMFLGSLDDGWALPDPTSGEVGGGNVTTMEAGWERIWRFLARADVAAIDPARAEELCQPDALSEHVWLPETRRIRAQRLSATDVERHTADGTLAGELIDRGEQVAGALNLLPGPITLKDEQRQALTHLAEGRDVLGILPTGFGKSFLFQLPGLILPGVTVVVSPLVSLMTDQALRLNRTVGGQVRALTGPMRESNSRQGKAEVLQQLTGQADHGIKLVYLSPERLASAQFQGIIEQGVKAGVVRLIAFDEAHTLAAWGDSFRPSIRRAEHFVRRLRATYGAPQLLAVTATATRSVSHHLLAKLFDVDPHTPDPDRVAIVTANPIRSDLATYKRLLPARRNEADALQVTLVERMLDDVDGHAIVYCTTVKEVERVHSYLSGQMGRRRRVLKYHGRVADIEKASVADYFSTAPKKGDPDGYRPMVVVATQAFGLGIDRDDVRLVLCASPPGDLSALYQALGRAGRDQANQAPDELVEQTVGAAVLTPKAWGTLKWMNRHDPATGTLITQVVDAIVAGASPLDVDGLVTQLIDEGIAAGRLPDSAVDDDYLEDAYKSLVVRTFAALADRGVIDDLGDAPARVTIRPGESLASDTSEAAELAQVVLDARPDGEAVVDLGDLWAELPADVADELGDLGSMWYELLALHATGHLDITQRSNEGFSQTANYRVVNKVVGMALEDELLALQRARIEDLQLMREWFQDDTSCVLDGLADYFRSPDAGTDGVCDHHLTRCSSCWHRPESAGEDRPALLDALMTDVEVLRGSLSKVVAAERRKAEKAVEQLLCDLPFGLGMRKLKAALKGEEFVYTGPHSKPLPWRVRASEAFAKLPQVTDAELSAALDRLVTKGTVVKKTAGHGGSWFQHASVADPAASS